MNTLLSIKNFSVTFSLQDQDIPVVQNISLQIAEEESVGIVGESGSGKTTLVHASLGLLEKATVQGEVFFKNTPYTTSILGTQIGVVFQDPMNSLNPLIKIGEQIAEGLIVHHQFKKSKARKKALEMLHLVGISNPHLRIDQYPHQFSGGQRQRICLAAALATNPKLLILDEPTTSLDPITQKQILDVILELKKVLKMALLFISHDLSVISYMCTKIFVMHNKEIVEQGPTSEIFNSPKHPYTQKLIKARFQ